MQKNRPSGVRPPHPSRYAGLGFLREHARAVPVEPEPVPSVHPTLFPTTAIRVPLQVSGDQTSVWRRDRDQRMLIAGHVGITVGYRELHADSAAIWLSPTNESGENTYDVAIYLSGNVEVREGPRPAQPPPLARNSWSPLALPKVSNCLAPRSASPKRKAPWWRGATNYARSC